MLPDRRPPRTPRLTPLPVDSGPLSIAVVGPSRFGIAEPFAGGLEAHTAGLVRRLHSLGHRLTVAAGPERCANDLPVRLRPIVSNDFDHLFTGRRDISPPAEFLAHETERYQVLVDDLVGRRDIDVIHNNSLHPAMVDADPARVAIVHVLHCPPTPELWAAHVRLAERDGDRRVIAVSASVAAAWKGLATDTVLNGVDTSSWHPTAAGHSGAVWAGRIVPEKAPHLAIRACRLAGIPLTLAGPVGDESYFRRFVERELVGPVEWVGPLDSCELAELYASCEVGVVSPVWDEPFGLVAAEMLASGTPVAAFDRGGLSEYLCRNVAALASPGDAVSLAVAIKRARGLDRGSARAHAVDALSADRMVSRYLGIHRERIADVVRSNASGLDRSAVAS